MEITIQNIKFVCLAAVFDDNYLAFEKKAVKIDTFKDNHY
jgi:hypothetical protein